MRGGRRPILAAGCLAALAVLAASAPASAKVSATFDQRVLTVTGDESDDRAVVLCDGGEVKVNGSNPVGGAVKCGGIVEVDAEMGGGSDVIDFSRIDASFGEARFPGFGVGTGTAALGGPGNDRYIPSQGAFNIFFGEAGNDRARGGKARDVLNGGGGDDTLAGSVGRDTLVGGGGDDRLLGGAAGDLLSGGPGDDGLFGEAGSDVLGGGPGRDKLRGGPGGDRLVGGADKDDLNGGPGKDTEIEKDP